MDAIIEILPFFLAEVIKQSIQAKFRNHNLPLLKEKTVVLLSGMIFRELYGYETSELCLTLGKKKFIKSFAEKIKVDKERKQ